MKTEQKNSRAIYALYSNNQFISWLYGICCQLTSTPKFYCCGENHEKQSEIVLANLKSKLERANIKSKSVFGFDRLDNLIAESEGRDYEVLEGQGDFSLGVFFIDEEDATKEVLDGLAQNGKPEVAFSVNLN